MSASPAVAVADDDEQDENELRERDIAEKYVLEHELEVTLNEVINKVVADRPGDPFLVLSSLLYGKATSQRGIFHVQVKEVLDGRGLPGILVRLHTGKGIFEGTTSSECTGIPDRPEAFDEFAPTVPLLKQRYGGQGFRLGAERAEAILNEKLLNLDPSDQKEIDSQLLILEPDLGRNITLAASIAACKAGAKYTEIPLFEYIAKLEDVPLDNTCIPMPLFSIINAGKYASNSLYVQEIFMMPTSAKNFQDALQIGAEFNRAVQAQMENRGLGFSNFGGFGGFTPQLQTIKETFQILQAAAEDTRSHIEAAGTTSLLATDSVTPLTLEFGIDFSASEYLVPPTVTANDPTQTTQEGDETLTQSNKPPSIYNLDKWVPGSQGKLTNSEAMIEVIRTTIRELGLTTIIDPFDHDDMASFTSLLNSENEVSENATEESARRKTIGGDPNCRLQIVGKKLFEYQGVEAVQEERACNTIAVQLDQFANVSRMLSALNDARGLGISVILGVASGHSSIDAGFLAALAIGTGVGQVKFGGLSTSECVERYNQIQLTGVDAASITIHRPGPAFVGSEFRR